MCYGSHYFVQVLLLCPAPHLVLVSAKQRLLFMYNLVCSCFFLFLFFLKICSHCTHISVPEQGPKGSKYDDQTNSIKPNLLNPIQASKIPVPLKMPHPLVLIPVQCCLQQLFFLLVLFWPPAISLSLSFFLFHFVLVFFLLDFNWPYVDLCFCFLWNC